MVTRRKALLFIASSSLAAGATLAAWRKRLIQLVTKETMNTNTPITRTGRLEMPWATPDPFLFCVHHNDHYPAGNEHLGPQASLAGRSIGQDFAGKDGWNMYHGATVPGFPQHPHRGFETITVVRRGLIDHSDSAGASARYGDGDVQWLTAGRGILHSEMFPLLNRDGDNPVELFQIWLNLPRSNKFAEPHFSMFWKDAVPRVVSKDDAGRTTEITVVAGNIGGAHAPTPPPQSWASQAGSDVAVWTIKLSPGAKWTLSAAPEGVNRRLYFFKGGELRIDGQTLPSAHWADLRSGFDMKLEAGPDEVEALILQGRPINEPVVQYGPFVMNSRAEIQQAFEDFQRTQFGGWPWKADDHVHGRAEARFARHADGRVERPT